MPLVCAICAKPLDPCDSVTDECGLSAHPELLYASPVRNVRPPEATPFAKLP
jgi:hypothetical protein